MHEQRPTSRDKGGYIELTLGIRLWICANALGILQSDLCCVQMRRCMRGLRAPIRASGARAPMRVHAGGRRRCACAWCRSTCAPSCSWASWPSSCIR